MTDLPEPQPLHLPARTIPVPSHLSPEARAIFALNLFDAAESPPVGDKAAWRTHVAETDAKMLTFLEVASAQISATVTEEQVGAATVYHVVPQGVAADDRRIYLDLHGGALVYGGGRFTKLSGMMTATTIGRRVCSPDYRMPPDHPYPAGLDDCVAAYRRLLQDHAPEDIIIGGNSAGGNLAAATVLKARDLGLPLPAAAVLLTPEVDLTESGDSFQTNLGLDTALTRSLMPANLLYADGADLTDPYVSPLFGDFAKGFPPTLLATGTRDLFLSNTVRMHAKLRAAEVRADLYIVDAASHTGLPRSPEGMARDTELRRFIARFWG